MFPRPALRERQGWLRGVNCCGWPGTRPSPRAPVADQLYDCVHVGRLRSEIRYTKGSDHDQSYRLYNFAINTPNDLHASGLCPINLSPPVAAAVDVHLPGMEDNLCFTQFHAFLSVFLSLGHEHCTTAGVG